MTPTFCAIWFEPWSPHAKPPSSPEVYLTCGVTDLRKSIDGLAAVVQEQFQLNPFSTAQFVFCNRQRNKLKILQWDHAGFWLYYRRLEQGTFACRKAKVPPHM
ncbi:IS66 family insertion sequence element accessory protein TnpB [Paenibacillus phytohabitans]|uniref:IS66 family insertion sequence element accessory protein TnpB n=1 Tax=Paenibacillus phytohabitans TaxID=2654978 RepID=UPI00248437DD|nr:IS66 family insertion sequence element accessory protein TnpB [Paenibacillus phytohabitans]